MGLPGVVGTAEGEFGGSACILVLVATTTLEIERRVPDRFRGYRVIVKETGQIKALD